MAKRILLLGASGSIGSQTISVIQKYCNDFELVGISVNSRTRKIPNIIKHHPSIKAVVLGDKSRLSYFVKKYPHIKFFVGEEGLCKIIPYLQPEMMVNALVGFVGLKPTIEAIKLNVKVALANKESLVVGGELVNKLLKKYKGTLYPIDSEHSALWKCLKVDDNNVDKLVITASGGAFRNYDRKDLTNVTKEDALKHPTWKMGEKITIDCATMVNKAFEIIEAYYLFDYSFDRIQVLLHDESMIHSMVKYKDGLYRADINHPDMKNPIKFALFEGNFDYKTFVSDDYHKFGDYHFHEFISSRYPSVKYAEKVIKEKGTYGAVFNASNEEANLAFREGKIGFLDIDKIIAILMDKHINKPHPTLNQIIKCDKQTRNEVKLLIKKGGY